MQVTFRVRRVSDLTAFARVRTRLASRARTTLARSDNGGSSWSTLPFDGQPFAIALTDGAATIGIVTRATEFFRSEDGGRTWPGPDGR